MRLTKGMELGAHVSPYQEDPLLSIIIWQFRYTQCLLQSHPGAYGQESNNTEAESWIKDGNPEST